MNEQNQMTAKVSQLIAITCLCCGEIFRVIRPGHLPYPAGMYPLAFGACPDCLQSGKVPNHEDMVAHGLLAATALSCKSWTLLVSEVVLDCRIQDSTFRIQGEVHSSLVPWNWAMRDCNLSCGTDYARDEGG
jgi:hypothetical protein